MSQGQILQILEKDKNKWFTAKEIQIALKLSQGAVNNSLVNLKNGGFVDFTIRKAKMKCKNNNVQEYNQYLFKHNGVLSDDL